MKRMIMISLIALMCSGCAGLGINKKCTVVPDVIGVYYENAPTGMDRDYKTLKVGGKAEWKLQ